MTEQARKAELLWGTQRSPQRGPKPKLSVATIVETASAIADAEGLAALSMQRIAGELGYTKMSLYRYVPGRAELTALMLDAALGEPPVLDGEWRSQLHALAMRLWTVLHRHPWGLELAVGPRVFGQHELGWMEAGLRALAGTGLSGPERLDAVVLLTGHVRALVQQTTAPASAPDGLEQELGVLLADILREHGDRYPESRSAFAEAGERDNALEFGITRILDGLSVLISSRAGNSPEA